MKIIRIAVAAIVVFVSVSSSLAADELQAARAKYAELAAKVRAGDSGIDWKALRVAAAIGELGSSSEDFQQIKNGYAALEQHKFQDALKIGREVEGHNVADADAHYLAWRSLVELGRQDDAEKERKLLAALFDSISQSGDGKSAKTAWFAATIREEYLFMQSILNVQFESQHTAMQDGHYFDVVMVKDDHGKESVLWFNADTELQRQLAAGSRASQKQETK